MELNLRKARKLESKIGNLIRENSANLSTNKSVRVNADISSEILPELVKAREEFLVSFENINLLIEARFEIRSLIAQQNEASGINANITKKVQLESKLSQLNKVINSFDYLDEKELEDEASRYRALLENGDRWSSSNFNANFLAPKDASDFQAKHVELAKNIEAIEDDLLDLNASTKIKLDKKTVDLLQANNLL